ncbi:transposase [Acinetobacter pittii]|uniref:transposase n=1 Tax=Acinetobacter pittii TaxID=48296 RepID=UPI0039C634EB
MLHQKANKGEIKLYSDAAIQCCLMIKSLFRLSLRMVTGLSFDCLYAWSQALFKVSSIFVG